MKKIFILLGSIFLVLTACSEEIKIYEPNVYQDSVDFPFETRDHGKFLSIFKNESENTIPITLIMKSDRTILSDSQNYDFCPVITNIRNGIAVTDWMIINLNYPIISEGSIENKNDNPNLISYSLPKGTYSIFTMDNNDCNRNQYSVFDILTDDGIALAQ